MAKKRNEIVVPASEPEWESPPPEGHARAVSLLPWSTYDLFVRDCFTVLELTIQNQASESSILLDIEQMRNEMRRFDPLLHDREADHIRKLDLLIRDAIIEGSAQSLRIRADAEKERAIIVDRAASRQPY